MLRLAQGRGERVAAGQKGIRRACLTCAPPPPRDPRAVIDSLAAMKVAEAEGRHPRRDHAWDPRGARGGRSAYVGEVRSLRGVPVAAWTRCSSVAKTPVLSTRTTRRLLRLSSRPSIPSRRRRLERSRRPSRPSSRTSRRVRAREVGGARRRAAPAGCRGGCSPSELALARDRLGLPRLSRETLAHDMEQAYAEIMAAAKQRGGCGQEARRVRDVRPRKNRAGQRTRRARALAARGGHRRGGARGGQDGARG